jgi:16S rRNA (guanine527-N7)-methyltransferase
LAIILSVVGSSRDNDYTVRQDAASPARVTERLSAYLDELARWNTRLNLTAVPPAERWERHVVASLRFAERIGLRAGDRVVDVGSGGGAPGMVIAIAHPEVVVTLLEADARKGAFLTHAAGLLGVAAVSVVTERAETAGHDAALRERFDVAVSRATAPAPVLCELALPFVRVGGALFAQVSDAPGDAVRCRAAAVACGGEPPQALEADVLCVPKASPTPPAYPRRVGVPSRRPLR